MSMDLPSDFHNTVLCSRCNATFSAPICGRLQEVYAQARTDDMSTLNVDQIRNALSDAQRHLARYDDEISRLDSIAAKLRQEREEYRACVKATSSLLAPVRRMPTELLSQVFYHCSRYRDWSNNIARPEGVAPLNLGLVCRRWRDIVVSTKGLWSDIRLDLDNDIHYTPNIIGDILTMFLERSEPRPLYVFLDVRLGDPEYYEEPLRILAQSSWRWRKAVLYICDTMCNADGALAPIKGNLSFLEELEIETSDGSVLGEHDTIFLDCPKLHTVAFAAGANPAIPWGQILSYRAVGSDIDAAVGAVVCVQRSPSLNELIIDEVNMPNARIMSDVPPFSSNLQILSLTRVTTTTLEASSLSSLLDILVLPSLKSLSVATIRFSWEERPTERLPFWPQEAVTRFLRRSACRLESLTLICTTLTFENLLEVLRLTPVLSRLQIHEKSRYPPIATSAFLETITHPPATGANGPLFLPRLTHIDFSIASQLEPSSLFRMIESRWAPEWVHSAGSGGVACLEHVALRLTERDWDASSLARFHELRLAGLRLLVR